MSADRQKSTQSFAACWRACQNLAMCWPEADRKLWLQLLEDSFKLIYKDQEAAN
jgi:hypothetical protein